MKTASLIKIGIASILVVYIFVFSNSGIFTRLILNSRIRSLRKEIEYLKKENRNLEVEIEKLKDPEYVAEIAYKLGFIKPGEKVFKFYKKNISKTEEKTDLKKIVVNTLKKYKPIIIIIFIVVFVILVYRNFNRF